MNEGETINILKKALLLEKRGKAFYGKAAQNTENEGVKRFFELMAAEEEQHVKILTVQYKHYLNGEEFSSDNYEHERNGDAALNLLTDQIMKKISAAEFEAAAISAAVAMEERAIKLYSDGAAVSDTPDKKKLYNWLADWEREHLRVLIAVDRELTESVWYDNQFWPF
jgi:rubrerythrin